MSNAADSASSTPSVTAKPTRVLACVLCQHRRIKCDRSFPCANCLKSNKTCVPATPAPIRRRRRFKPDLQERLAHCEQLLKEYAAAKPADAEASVNTPQASGIDTPGAIKNLAATRKPSGKLVKDDGGVRFMDSALLGTVYDELRMMRTLVDDDSVYDASPQSSEAIDEGLDLLGGGYESLGLSLEELQPPPAHVFKLWQTYTERVNPLTKIIHVPSLQPYLVEAAANPEKLPTNIQALLFSIYTLATVSMTMDECWVLFGYSRDAAIDRFSSGTHIALNRTGFLRNHDLETLQALLIYLISLQNRYNRHAAWLLTGVVVRMAQKMGLHKDGEALGLSPFDTEIRRRVWWQILMVDAKFATLSGMNQEHLPRFFDTKEPKNINDADLFPSATEPIAAREGPTEMVWILLVNKVTKFLVDVPDLEPLLLIGETEAFKDPDSPMKGRIDEYRRKLSGLGNTMLSTLDKYCDPSTGPVHELALDVHRFIGDKMEEIVKPPEEQRYYHEIKTPNDNAFRIAVSSIEHYIHQQLSTKDTTFHWYFRLHLQVQVLQYLMGQLNYRTEGQLVDKAWEIMPLIYEFHEELFDVTQKSHHNCAVFILRAWSKREADPRHHTGETPSYIAKLQKLVSEDDVNKIGELIEKASVSEPAQIVVDDMQIDADPTLLGHLPIQNDLLDMDALGWDVWQNFGGGTAPMAALGGYGMGPTVNW